MDDYLQKMFKLDHEELAKNRVDSFNAGKQRAISKPNFEGDITSQARHVRVEITRGNQRYALQETSGFQGRAGVVHRPPSRTWQSKSKGTGDDNTHAHKGSNGGQPAGSLFNSKSNRYNDIRWVEAMLDRRIAAGDAVYLVTRDVFALTPKRVKGDRRKEFLNPNRPIARKYKWIIMNSKGKVEFGEYAPIGNFSTETRRKATEDRKGGSTPKPPKGQKPKQGNATKSDPSKDKVNPSKNFNASSRKRPEGSSSQKTPQDTAKKLAANLKGALKGKSIAKPSAATTKLAGKAAGKGAGALASKILSSGLRLLRGGR